MKHDLSRWALSCLAKRLMKEVTMPVATMMNFDIILSYLGKCHSLEHEHRGYKGHDLLKYFFMNLDASSNQEDRQRLSPFAQLIITELRKRFKEHEETQIARRA